MSPTPGGLPLLMAQTQTFTSAGKLGDTAGLHSPTEAHMCPSGWEFQGRALLFLKQCCRALHVKPIDLCVLY